MKGFASSLLVSILLKFQKWLYHYYMTEYSNYFKRNEVIQKRNDIFSGSVGSFHCHQEWTVNLQGCRRTGNELHHEQIRYCEQISPIF
jgi:hypothetical protein